MLPLIYCKWEWEWFSQTRPWQNCASPTHRGWWLILWKCETRPLWSARPPSSGHIAETSNQIPLDPRVQILLKGWYFARLPPCVRNDLISQSICVALQLTSTRTVRWGRGSTKPKKCKKTRSALFEFICSWIQLGCVAFNVNKRHPWMLLHLSYSLLAISYLLSGVSAWSDPDPQFKAEVKAPSTARNATRSLTLC